MAGKAALITGGGSGLGQFPAMALAEAGAFIDFVGGHEDWLRDTHADRQGAVFAVDVAEAEAKRRFNDVIISGYRAPAKIILGTSC